MLKSVFLFTFILLFSLNPLSAQDLEEVKEELLGTWRMDIERTRDEYELLKKHMSSKRVRLFEEFLKYYEVYQWTFSDEIMSISFKISGQNMPSQNAKWNLSKEEFTKKEEVWIGRSTLFTHWSAQDQAIWINANRQQRVIISLDSKELIVFDEGTPLVFNRIEY